MTVTSASDSLILNDYIAKQKAAAAAANTSTSSTTETSITKVTGDFNTFLKILTTQMKNQDPTAPMDANTFTQQLVQFSSIEQQINANGKLDNILKALNSNGITPLMSYVGQYVEAESTGKLAVQGGSAKLAYDLPKEAQSVKISVQDGTGKVIATIDGTKTSGMNRVAWDGTLDSGGKAKDGTYKFVLTAKDSAGEAIKVEDVRIIGAVTGIETDSSGAAILKIGDLSVKDTTVKSVFANISTTAGSSSG